MSLIMDNTPDDLRVVMIDPKMVELIRYNGLPHLYGKVETEIRAHGCVTLGDARDGQPLQEISDLGVRHVNEYNAQMLEKGADSCRTWRYSSTNCRT
jgi:S-DNA-T family DNA segregation ATPase FtsK/SpoIIIE